MMDSEHHLRPHACPYCGAMHNAATGLVDDESPQAGDITICIRCAGIIVFTKKLGFRKPTKKEREECSKDPFVQKAITAIVAIAGKDNGQ